MMKRSLIIMLFLAAVTLGAQAQSYKSAIGLRLGDPTGVTFKTFITKTNALELLMGTGYWGNNFAFAGYYEWQNATGWTPNLDWFAGPGVHIGFWNETYQEEYSSGVLVGVDGVVGLEYTLEDIPLNFAFGVGPSIQFTGGPDPFYWNGGISVRYIF
jgi:hypothetical protein